LLKQDNNALEIGKFRNSGEIHQWMYDRYSLNKLLFNAGFQNITIKSAFQSQVPNWNKYQLDVKDGIVLKPDSIFIEGIKK
jgi:hypothetical protein